MTLSLNFSVILFVVILFRYFLRFHGNINQKRIESPSIKISILELRIFTLISSQYTIT